MKKLQILIIIALLLCSSIGECLTIRIGLINDESSVKLSATGYCELLDLESNKTVLTTYYWSDGFVESTSTGLNIKGLCTIKGPLLLRPIAGSMSRVNGIPYRGEIEIIKTKHGLCVINVIELEEYLYGVIESEIDKDAPLEALKAQAVIARSFALANLSKHKNEGYNLCPYTHCQVYKGVRAETPRVIEAVDATRGQVITYGDDVAQTFYHSSCGGQTSDAKSVWGIDLPYLQGINCPFCGKASKSLYWQATIKLSDIQAILNKNGLRIGDIYSFSTVRSGIRIKTLIIEHSSGITEIEGHKFRSMLGSTRIWSTNFDITKNGDSITFRGIGKGHGVGLCQWGARVMGELGYNYKQILGFYYSSAYLRTVTFNVAPDSRSFAGSKPSAMIVDENETGEF